MASKYSLPSKTNEDRKRDIRNGVRILSDMYPKNAHFVFELIQNADDVGATSVTFELTPSELLIYHDGQKSFDVADVNAICTLGESTKANDLTKIGKFGVGFKAVYRYTSAPEIHSGGYHFAVPDDLEPVPAPERTLSTNGTLFVLPFNSEEGVRADLAFDQIRDILEEMDSRALLFLSSVQSIHWRTSSGQSGHYQVSKRPLDNHPEVYYAQLTLQADSLSPEVRQWLLFERNVEDHPQLKLSVAYALREDDGHYSLEHHDEDRELFVYFPTTTITGLQFLIHGPYQVLLARNDLPQVNTWNEKLINETAELTADSLRVLRDEGLLDLTSLQLLPIRESDFPQTSRFRPIFGRVRESFLKEELLPDGEGGYTDAQAARLATSAELRSLITCDQLSSLFDSETQLRWLDAGITESSQKTSDLWKYLTTQLAVPSVRPRDFGEQINESFLQQQSDTWMIAFYRFLGSRGDLWREPPKWWNRGSVRNKPFIRLQDDQLVPPFEESGQPRAFLPPESQTDFPTVKREIYSDAEAAKFLRDLGLKEPDLVDDVVMSVLRRYSAAKPPSSIDSYLADMRRIAHVWAAVEEDRRTELERELAKCYCVLAMDVVGDVQWRRPGEVYQPSPELTLYFEGNPAISFAHPRLIDDEAMGSRFLTHALGMLRAVPVFAKRPDSKGHVVVRRRKGNHKRGLEGFDPERMIEGLEHALLRPTPEKIMYIWNELLVRNIDGGLHGTVETATDQTYQRNYGQERVWSPLGDVLRHHLTLPDANGEWHRPQELHLNDLPEGFIRNQDLASALGMMTAAYKQIADDYGLEENDVRQVLEAYATNPALFSNVIKQGTADEEREELTDFNFRQELDTIGRPAQHRGGVSYSWGQRPVRDLDGRRQRIKDDIANAQALEPDPSERSRYVFRKQWEPRDPAVRVFLREEYRGRCQICGDTFLQANSGEPYFEAVYIVSRRNARWLDRPGNVLCLCPTHSAQFRHGELELAEPLSDQALDEANVVSMRLCGVDVTVEFTERHIMDLRELIKASS